jgi:hypothetical protein
MKKKEKKSWKKKKESNFGKKRGKVGKKMKKKEEKTLWITIVIHSDLGVGEPLFPHTI